MHNKRPTSPRRFTRSRRTRIHCDIAILAHAHHRTCCCSRCCRTPSRLISSPSHSVCGAHGGAACVLQVEAHSVCGAHGGATCAPPTQCVERMAERRARFRSRRTRIIAPARAAVASIDCAASISRSWSSASSIKSVSTLGGADALGATCATGGMAGGYCR
jgi:hypothetical protein